MPAKTPLRRRKWLPTWPQGRFFRFVRAAAVAFLALEALYVVAVNVLLWTPLFGKAVNAQPDVVDIHYARAWSFWPTRVYATGLSIRATDSHVEWILRLDDVDFDCSLLGLARKQFHVTRARGTGISFRVRMKVPPPGATPEEQRWLPPIDSLGPVGVTTSTKYPGTWSDKDWDLWTIHLQDVVAEHVHEVWIDGARFEGDARIKGGFYLKPIRAAEVGPAHVDVRSGEVMFRAGTVATPLAASLDFMLDRFDPRTISDADLLHHISLSADARTAIPDLHDLPITLPKSDTLDGHVDVPRLALRIVHGVIKNGTALDVTSPKVQASVDGRSFSTGARITADVTGDRLDAKGALSGIETSLGISVGQVTIAADSAALDLAAPLGDLHGTADMKDAEARDLSKTAAVLLAHTKDAPVRIVHGEAHGAAHVEAWRADEKAHGDVTLHATGIDALIEGRLHARGSMNVTASIGSARFGSKRSDGAHDGTLDHVEAHLDAAHLTLADGALDPMVSVAHVTLQASSPRLLLANPLPHMQLVANLEGGKLGDTSALRAIFPADAGFTLTSNGAGTIDADASAELLSSFARGAGSLRLRGVGVSAKKIRATADVDAVATVGRWDFDRRALTGDVRLTAKNITGSFDPNAPAPEMVANRLDAHASARDLQLAHAHLRDLAFDMKLDRAELADARALNAFLPSPGILAIESGRAIVSASLDTTRIDHAGTGDLHVWLPGVGLRLHETHLAGDITVEAKARATDATHSEIDLEGSRIGLRNIRVSDSGSTAAWAGDVILEEGTLRMDPVARLAGSVSLRARDPSPMLGVLFRGPLPGIVAQITHMPELTAATDFVVEPDRLLVSNLIASGSDLSLLGTYAIRGEERRAAFVAQKGPWSAGLRMDDEGTHVHLFGLTKWYAEQRSEALRIVGCGTRPEVVASVCP